LLDEPLGALDKRLRIETQQQLKALHRELGITFVHVTHDQSEALALSSLLIVMRNGEIQQVGDPEVVYRRPNSLFAADFLGDMNFVPCELTIQHPTSIDVALPSGSVLSLPRELLAPVVDPSHGLILAFRPEDGVLGAPGRAQGGEEFGFEGTIRDQSFRDGWYDIRIATGAGDLLLRSSAACSLGEHVACVWPTSRVCLFPRDESFN
jgi:ABC-type Fe3+/spermidine/putrescine transport system ATPase subunit